MRSVIPIFKLDVFTIPPTVVAIGATTHESIQMVFPYDGQQPQGTTVGVRTLITLVSGDEFMSPWTQREVENALRSEN